MLLIPLPNSDYAIDNALVVGLVLYIFKTSTLICENTLLLSCFDKEKCLSKDGKWNLLGGKGTLIFFVKYVKCSLKTIQHKVPPLNLMYQENQLKHFSFSE